MTEPRKRSLPKLNLLTDVSLLPSLEASPIHSPWSERSKDFEAVMSATKLVAVNADQVWDLAYSDCNYIQRDLQELDKGMALFMESDFNAAETFFGTHQKATINTSYGYATIMFFKAFMSFDKKEIEAAFCAIEECLQICTVLRKKGSPLSTIWSAGGANACNTFKEMTLIEKHAELTHASAMFMKSVLSTLHNMTIGTIIREGLRLRANYQTFKAAFKYLEELYTEEGKAGFERQGIDAHLIAAVLFAVGGYNVIFSLVPAAYLKLFKIVGLHGDRQFGISCLETAASWKKVDYSIVYGESNGQKSSTVPFDMPARTLSLPSIHSFCADWALFTIHTALSPIITIPETDLKCVSIHLEMRLKAFPNSLMYSMFQGKYLKTMGDSTAAEKQLVQNIKDQKDWPTFVVGGMWCLGFLRASQGKLEQAAGW